MALYLSGVLTMGYVVIAAYFLRFWLKTEERLFAIFSTAFCMLAIENGVLAFVGYGTEHRHSYYLIRLLAFGLIAWGIIDRNRRT